MLFEPPGNGISHLDWRGVDGLELRSLTRRFGSRVALDELTLTVPAGTMFGLLGPNGAGKTTAMRIVLGILAPDAGEVRFRGRPLGEVERRRFGYLPEQRGLYPRMRVLDQLVYLGRLHGLARVDAEYAALRLLGRLELAERAGDRLEQLSHGNQQRVQLAAALIHGPEVLILDEPFSGLDPLAVRTLAALLRELTADGRTVVFSSHQLGLVEDLCQLVAVIDSGRVVLSGEVRDLKERSTRRVLRVDVEADGTAWIPEGVRIASSDAGGTRLLLPGSADPLAVLDAARAAGTVRDFALELPSLNDLFLEAVAP
ncbi:MAG: ATP-binding cassette domain-containing protein [Thermoleophilia bacterium]|nr:ATP-binding cassette domain-containing protein [Thermoleophilia bacterium]